MQDIRFFIAVTIGMCYGEDENLLHYPVPCRDINQFDKIQELR
jgi:hypothetical protein